MASISTIRPILNSQDIYSTDATGHVTRPEAVTNLPGRGEAGVGRNAHPVPAAATDQARLSSTGTLIAQALQLSDVRTEKVAALRESIAAGTYHVPSIELAGRLIDALAS